MSTNACEENEQTIKILEEKAKRRKLLRNYFQKQRTDPFRHASGEGGVVFDPAIQRYIAMQASQFEYFKPSLKNALFGIFAMIVPMVSFGYLVHKDRSEIERRLRAGDVDYKDRIRKFI
ncbi:uncharacterized protein LOC108903180 [Anoplophora glabripennis]|uniref:uncharacterized protein LOC108903180 n=1 Tax=Anoplophora glabripennis TaxID=217634 RepID=UPI000875A548|nr:uncharacterized protein LOC108903180 [Anoplophora glabripennis]